MSLWEQLTVTRQLLLKCSEEPWKHRSRRDLTRQKSALKTLRARARKNKKSPNTEYGFVSLRVLTHPGIHFSVPSPNVHPWLNEQGQWLRSLSPLGRMILKEGKGHSPERLKGTLLINIFYKTFAMLLAPNKWLNVRMERFIEHVIPWCSYLMISRGRSSRTMEPRILARIIKSHFQVRRLDPNVWSSASLMYRSWKVNNHTGTTEALTEDFGGDLGAPPAEVTASELFCAFNSIIWQFCEQWMSLFPCGSQTPNPVWKWQASSPPCSWRQPQVRTMRRFSADR